MRFKRQMASGQAGQEQGFRTSWEDLNYRNYNANHPDIHAIFSSHPDRREAEDVIWLHVKEVTGDPDLATLLSSAIIKRHPECKGARAEYAMAQREELVLARERRRINRESGGKVVLLENRRKSVEDERRRALKSGDRHARIASSVKMEAAIRQYWSDLTKLARIHISKDWKPPETRVTMEELGNRPLLDFVLSLDELVNLELPERENIVAPFLPAQSLSMVFAPRGLGKSWFCMELALAVADGRRFLAWDVPRARRVLYVDGEMPQKTLVDRFKALCRGVPRTLDVLPSERLWVDDRAINLNNQADQQRISELLEQMEASERKPELIIIDNLSSMTSGGDENSNSELDSLLRFLISLRHKGYAIVLVHHSGKSGDQRGASRREDLLDTSIKLGSAKATDARATGAKFAIEFVKTRGEKPTPDKLAVELVSGQDGGVEWVLDRQEAAPAYMKVLTFIRDNNPRTQNDIASGLMLAQSRVSELLAKAREKGLVDKGQVLTPKGIETVKEFDPF